MATRTISALGGNWTDTAAWDEAAVPTAADDVVATSLSGNLTVNSSVACRSLNFTDYVGTFTLSSGRTSGVSIGDGTAGDGNVALKLVSGMTAAISGSIGFLSTSGTQQTITFAEKTTGTLTFNGSGGSWIFSDAVNCTSINLVAGSLDTNGQEVTVTSNVSLTGASTRALTLGTSTITLSTTAAVSLWDATTTTNLTFSGASSTIGITGTGSNNQTFAGGGLTYGTVNIATGGTGILTFSGSNTFTKLAVTGGSTKTVRFTAGTNTTLTGSSDAFFSGAASNLITLESTTGGSAWNLSKSSGIVSSDYLSLKDSAAAGGATFYAGANSTNVSGNSGWSFVAAPTGPTAAQLMLLMMCG